MTLRGLDSPGHTVIIGLTVDILLYFFVEFQFIFRIYLWCGGDQHNSWYFFVVNDIKVHKTWRGLWCDVIEGGTVLRGGPQAGQWKGMTYSIPFLLIRGYTVREALTDPT